MECDNGYQKIYHPIDLKQTSKCKTALGLKKGYDKKLTEGFKIPYSTELRKIIPTVWNEDIFESIDTVVCPITSCS